MLLWSLFLYIFFEISIADNLLSYGFNSYRLRVNKLEVELIILLVESKINWNCALATGTVL